uniref:Basic helix-loop-helix family member e40 n=1 Tax=Leptobrachium leishanense TaxID=445787 RepID=A0A8C5PTM9_9ANUR
MARTHCLVDNPPACATCFKVYFVSADTYKLPHRLIEKKRRDRINECISQLKDLLPEHLKLTTLGHLEKAVVLELTLKHVQALSSLIEQQQNQILTLQNGEFWGSLICMVVHGGHSREMFRSGFQLCAEEALRFLQGGERRELVAHLHRVVSDLSRSPPRTAKVSEKPPAKGQATNCVPVIRRAAPMATGEQSGTDTDTDSGYGGEVEKAEGAQEQRGAWKDVNHCSPRLDRVIKQEQDEVPKKRPRMEAMVEQPRFNSSDLPPVDAYSSHPLCLPFYLIPPSASAYLPMLEKCWYPGSMPMLYPSMPHSGLLSQDSVQVHSPAMSSLDSSALMHTMKSVAATGTDAKD